MKRGGFKQKTYEEVLTIKKSKKTSEKGNFKRIRGGTKTIPKLKKELWKVFSPFIRERDKYTCFTCGKKAIGSGMHAGHFITGATCSAELYFNEINVHAQCFHCNINLSGNWVFYEQKMISKYGQDVVDELKLKRTLLMGEKLPHEWYEQKIKHYKIQLQEMQK
jgi:DNA-directed RNA polymerase subunit N (RpoN/RPB10)